MIKLLRRNRIEEELGKSVKIFGKTISVNVIYSKIKNPELDLVGNIINVYLPSKYKRNGNVGIVKLAIEKMYQEIARVEIENVMEKTRLMLGYAPEDYEIKNIKNGLAKCTKDKKIIINPQIVKYSKKTIESIILQEYCKLKYRPNSKNFIEMLKHYMPNYETYTYMVGVNY